MDASPLTRQNRPGSFQPKIHLLYEQLFEAVRLRQSSLEAVSDSCIA